jgi:hypothetical protein
VSRRQPEYQRRWVGLAPPAALGSSDDGKMNDRKMTESNLHPLHFLVSHLPVTVLQFL